ncbi:MAG: hypothetical protein J0M24_06600 [Verrucomicrobia bacterium]|nr:hypothetical protein [Verrucomicrobiota bacterium]
MRLKLLALLLGSTWVAHAKVTLPIEVLGSAGHQESVTLTVPAGSPEITGLQLQIHGLTFENKASIRINNSGWSNLNNTSVVLPQVERAFWGIGGAIGTLRMVLPIAQGTAGEGDNVVQFRFNDLDGQSIGYRVLAVNFVAGNQPVVPETEFVADDPRSWTPVLNTPEAIAAGKALWYSAPLWERGIALRSNCGDCHAHDGRDLKYFNYSDKSIVERSVFHRLSRSDGEKIASYIRSLPIPYEENGRPWNPPYQPGPGLDQKPVRSWAAGAGLEWVLDNDLDTLRYLFPGGATTNSLDFTTTVNAREIPLVVQLPDWNRWLPKIHPNDAYPLIFPNHDFVRMHTFLRNQLVGTSGEAAGRIINGNKSNWDRASSVIPVVKPNRNSKQFAAYSDRAVGLAHWRVVKLWELMTEFQAEDVGHELQDPTVNDRRWFHGEVFRLAPHMLGTPKNPQWFTESMQWYQLQLVLNDGNRLNGSTVPIDWGYLHALNFSAWNNPAKMPTYGIAILNMVKGGEVGENGLPVGDKNGWNPYKQNIFWLAPGNHLKGMYASIDINTRRGVAEALIKPWLEKAETYTRRQYQAAGYLKPAFRDTTFETARNLHALGIDRALVNRMVAFGRVLWPNAKIAPFGPELLESAVSSLPTNTDSLDAPEDLGF